MKNSSGFMFRKRVGQGSGPYLPIHFPRNFPFRYACTGKPQWGGTLWLQVLSLRYRMELQHVRVGIQPAQEAHSITVAILVTTKWTMHTHTICCWLVKFSVLLQATTRCMSQAQFVEQLHWYETLGELCAQTVVLCRAVLSLIFHVCKIAKSDC
jgi:hypothetical protein